MLKSLMSSSGRQNDTTLVANGAVIDGTITFAGILEIEGRVNGDITARDDEQAVVRIQQCGHVYGNVTAPLVVINGTVSGNVCSSDHVELASKAVINGDVRYNLIEMMKGAQVNGRLVFADPAIAPASRDDEDGESRLIVD
jgi:cytoskeletal protein CcmA (bactofilin family)